MDENNEFPGCWLVVVGLDWPKGETPVFGIVCLC